VKTAGLCIGVWAAVCELEMTFHITTITVTVTVYVCCGKNQKYVTEKCLLAKTANP
jgi:hypothetical protein